MTQPPLDPEVRFRGGRMGWLFAAIWLIYLAYPIRAAWDLDTVPKVFGLFCIALFAVTYMVAFYVFRTRFAWPRPGPKLVWSVISLLVIEMVLAAIPLESGAFAMAVYISALAAFTLPTRQSWSVAIALAVAVFVVPLAFSGWEHQEALAFQLIVATFAAWGISQIILRNQQLAAARDQLAHLAVAEERLRVGRDVHDILGHSLTVITVKTELARRLIDVDVERAKVELADIERLSREALAGVRDTVGGLREVSLLGELANARSALSASGIQADLPMNLDAVPHERSEIYGWIVREGVTNVVRHSEARRCEIRVGPTSIEVLDDGRGVQADDAEAGSGLAGLRERIAAFDGSLRVGSRNGRGFRLQATFPELPTVAEARR